MPFTGLRSVVKDSHNYRSLSGDTQQQVIVEYLGGGESSRSKSKSLQTHSVER